MNMRFLLLAGAAAMPVACAGGQSGNEGDLPAPPCAGDGALLEATVLSVTEGCVELEVLRVVKAGVEVSDPSGNLLFSGQSTPGARLVGKFGMYYSWGTSFSAGDTVAALPVTWGGMLEFHLMHSDGHRIDGRWGNNEFTVSFEDIASPQCATIVKERLSPLESSPERGGPVQTVGQQDPPNCVE